MILVARPAKFIYILALHGVAKYPLRAIAIGHVDGTIGPNGRFGGFERHFFFINTNLGRMLDGEQYLALHVGFNDFAQIGIANKQEFLTVGVPERQAVPTGILVAPAIQQFAGAVVHQDVVFHFIAYHQQPSLAVLHHLVAVVDRKFGGIQIPPA